LQDPRVAMLCASPCDVSSPPFGLVFIDSEALVPKRAFARFSASRSLREPQIGGFAFALLPQIASRAIPFHFVRFNCFALRKEATDTRSGFARLNRRLAMAWETSALRKREEGREEASEKQERRNRDRSSTSRHECCLFIVVYRESAHRQFPSAKCHSTLAS